MSKTIRQLADELHVSKTAIRKRMTQEFRENYVETTGNGTILISDEGCKAVAETLQPIPETPQTNSENNSGNQQTREQDSIYDALAATIEVLRNQLEAKDAQIAALNDRLSEANQITVHTQQLHGADKVLKLQEPKKSFFSLFRRTPK